MAGSANRVVVITGASSGIGRSMALAFARQGATTILVARSLEALERVVEEARRHHPGARAIAADVSSREHVNEMVSRVEKELGRIDVLINNAGGGAAGPVDGTRFIGDVRALLESSLFGKMYCTEAVLPIMRRQGSGHIVNLSSVVGRKALPGFGAYSVAMHAVTAYSDVLRQELHGSGIKVSTIHPAITRTAFFTAIPPADIPPPFRRMTFMAPDFVAARILRAVHTDQARLVLPWQARVMLQADAWSPRLGDLIVRLMSTSATFMKLVGLYRRDGSSTETISVD